MSEVERRRAGPSRYDHALTVYWVADRLQVRCVCGRTVGGHRKDDWQQISLSDLLELVRLHHQQLNTR